MPWKRRPTSEPTRPWSYHVGLTSQLKTSRSSSVTWSGPTLAGSPRPALVAATWPTDRLDAREAKGCPQQVRRREQDLAAMARVVGVSRASVYRARAVTRVDPEGPSDKEALGGSSRPRDGRCRPTALVCAQEPFVLVPAHVRNRKVLDELRSPPSRSERRVGRRRRAGAAVRDGVDAVLRHRGLDPDVEPSGAAVHRRAGRPPTGVAFRVGRSRGHGDGDRGGQLLRGVSDSRGRGQGSGPGPDGTGGPDVARRRAAARPHGHPHRDTTGPRRGLRRDGRAPRRPDRRLRPRWTGRPVVGLGRARSPRPARRCRAERPRPPPPQGHPRARVDLPGDGGRPAERLPAAQDPRRCVPPAGPDDPLWSDASRRSRNWSTWCGHPGSDWSR